MSARIKISSVSARLGPRQVLSDISAEFSAGEVVGIVGPNGAGKSTLLRVMACLQPALSGPITLEGQPIGTHSRRGLAKHMAYLPQQRAVAWNINVEDLAALGRFALGAGRYASLGALDRSAVNRALEKAGAAAFIGRPVQTLSGGEQARAHLARALASPAQTLLLDEPCAALDIRHQLDLMDVLKAESVAGRTIILALHDLGLAQRYCDRAIVLDGGHKIADAAPADALSEAILKDVFGVKESLAGFARA